MKHKYKGLICCLFAIFILFFGMCMEQPDADSLFACVEKHETTSFIGNPEGTVSFYEMSAAKFLGVSNTAFIAASMKNGITRTFLRLSLLLYCAEYFLFKLSNLQAAVNINTSETFYSAVILNYIQSKDGKK